LTGSGPCASGQARMPESTQAIAGKLNIVIVEGEGAINNIKARTARAPIVQVEDENHRPVAGAAVAFSLPARGAGGSFLHGGKIFTVVSDPNGRAMAAAIKPNHALGVFKINVSASLHGQQLATATVTQTNAIATAGAGSAAAGGATGSGTSGAGAGGTAGTSTATGAGTSAGATGGATAGGTTGAAGTAAGTAAAGTAAAGTVAAGAAAAGVSATTIGVIAGGAAVAAGVAAKVATGGGSNNNTSTTPTPPTGTISAPGLPGFGPASAIRASSPFRSAGIVGLRTYGPAQFQPFARPNASIDKGIIGGSFGWRQTMPKLRAVTIKIPRLPVIGRRKLPLSGGLFPPRPSFVTLVALRAVRLAATHVSIAPPRVNNRIAPVRQANSKYVARNQHASSLP
jgi:hypothetical protein